MPSMKISTKQSRTQNLYIILIEKNVGSIEHLHDLFDYLNQKSEIQLIYLLGKDNKIFYQAKEFATFFQLETENYKNFARDLESHNE